MTFTITPFLNPLWNWIMDGFARSFYILNDEIRELLDKVLSQTRRNYNTLLRELNFHVGLDPLL